VRRSVPAEQANLHAWRAVFREALDRCASVAFANGAVTQGSLGISEADLLDNPYGFIRSLPILGGASAYTSNKDVDRAADEINGRPHLESGDVESSPEQRSYVNRVAPKLFRALEKFNDMRASGGEAQVELIIALRAADGGFVVNGAGLAPQGGRFDVPGGTTAFVLHFHNIGLERIPSKGDHAIALDLGVPNFAVTYGNNARCCSVYEVGSQRDAGSGKQRGSYRSIARDSSVGDWVRRSEW
jgi:hypothetical protein